MTGYETYFPKIENVNLPCKKRSGRRGSRSIAGGGGGAEALLGALVGRPVVLEGQYAGSQRGGAGGAPVHVGGVRPSSCRGVGVVRPDPTVNVAIGGGAPTPVHQLAAVGQHLK